MVLSLAVLYLAVLYSVVWYVVVMSLAIVWSVGRSSLVVSPSECEQISCTGGNPTFFARLPRYRQQAVPNNAGNRSRHRCLWFQFPMRHRSASLGRREQPLYHHDSESAWRVYEISGLRFRASLSLFPFTAGSMHLRQVIDLKWLTGSDNLAEHRLLNSARRIISNG
jgi:hypothetical protein